MGKRILFLMILPMLILGLAGVAQAWQGRMGGMSDSFGLVADESDYLIHPAKIANGQGVRFYGDYRFTYTGVTDWNYHLDAFTTAGVPIGFFNYDTSGQEFKHNALVGAGFPLGPGRMGLFFTYDGIRGDYDGDENHVVAYDLTKDLDNFALRLLYGLPIGGGFKLGGEVQFAYRQEENKNDMPGFLNYILGTFAPSRNLTPFQLPYDSKYWETLFKGSLDGKVGPLDLEFTLRAGFIFGGDNSLLLTDGSPNRFFDAGGDVTGWRIGGDVWARYPLAEDLTLPFLVRLDFQEKNRDGEGPGQGGLSSANNYPYESQERNLNLTIGGGVDKEIGKGARIAAGIYYNYLQGEYDITLNEIRPAGSSIWDHRGYPASVENQVMLRLAGEVALSPAVTLRMGLVPFYGWVKEDFTFTFGTPAPSSTDKTAVHGDHWGIGASLGGTIKFKPITLEPFVNFNYQQLKLNADGGEGRDSTGTITNLWEMDKTRNEWSIGGGFSILYDL